MEKIKKSIIFVTAFLLVLLCSWGALAINVSFGWQHFGNLVSIYYPSQWSTKGYYHLDEESVIPEGSTIKWISVDWDVGGFYGYSGIQVRLVNESGDWTYLENGKDGQILNRHFAGQTAKQKFYIQFRVSSMEFPGYKLFLKPNITFGCDTP